MIYGTRTVVLWPDTALNHAPHAINRVKHSSPTLSNTCLLNYYRIARNFGGLKFGEFGAFSKIILNRQTHYLGHSPIF